MLKKTKFTLSFDEHRRVESFFVLLLAIDNRLNKKEIKSRKKAKSKTKLKDRNIGPPIRGPFLFERSNELIYMNSMQLQYWKLKKQA